jgi:hypothetical protein
MVMEMEEKEKEKKETHFLSYGRKVNEKLKLTSIYDYEYERKQHTQNVCFVWVERVGTWNGIGRKRRNELPTI